MNNKGQVILFTLMVSIVILLLALALAPPIKIFVDSARNESSGDTIGLNCSTTDSNFIKGTCVFVDLYTPYFIGVVIALAGLAIGAKIMLSEG